MVSGNENFVETLHNVTEGSNLSLYQAAMVPCVYRGIIGGVNSLVMIDFYKLYF